MPTPNTRTAAARRSLAALALALAGSFACGAAGASDTKDASRGIEQALSAAQQDKRGVTLYVAGQVISGAVTRIEPGQWVELRNQTSGRIVVRLDRIDGLAAP